MRSSNLFKRLKLHVFMLFLLKSALFQGFEGMHHLAQKCIQLKPSFGNSGLTGLLNGILSENPEVSMQRYPCRLHITFDFPYWRCNIFFSWLGSLGGMHKKIWALVNGQLFIYFLPTVNFEMLWPNIFCHL
jgi:hypothetical protein